eukprot:scaffold14011_cov122-Isochrysis_galbana.AAC.5
MYCSHRSRVYRRVRRSFQIPPRNEEPAPRPDAHNALTTPDQGLQSPARHFGCDGCLVDRGWTSLSMQFAPLERLTAQCRVPPAVDERIQPRIRSRVWSRARLANQPRY